MQLNGISGPTMAASEPPEPPPRNPDKINASLKQFNEMKSTKSLDTTNEKSLNNKKIFKPILSLDNTIIHSAAAAAAASINKFIDSNSMDNNHKPMQNCIEIKQANDQIIADTTTSPTLATESTTLSVGSINKQIINDLANGGAGGIINNNISCANDITNSDKNNVDDKECNNSYTTAKPNELINKDYVQSKENNGTNNDKNNYLDQMIIRNGILSDLESPETIKMKVENERLTTEINRLKKLLENSPDGAVGGIEMSDNSYDAQSMDEGANKIERLENELRIAKELIQSLKAERKKLRADKNDLLLQVKQLCASLQDKEAELRNFIRTFEQRIRDSETSAAKMTTERERERWSLLKHARDEAERSIALAAQLNARDIQLHRTHEQLQEARRQLSGCMSDQDSIVSMAPLTPPSGLMGHLGGNSSSGYANLSGTPGDRGSCSADSGVRGSSDRESAAGDLNLSDGPCDNGPCITVDSDSISLVSSHYMNQFGTPKERSPTLSPLNAGAYSRSIDNGTISSRSVEQLGSPDTECPPPVTRRLNPKSGATIGRVGRGGTWGSISRVFARTRNRHKNTQPELDTTDFQWSPLTEEGYAEKLRLLREASAIPMERWRASQVLAWLEVALGMPQYSTRCSENVKSGKVLLELSDAELENGLGATHPMHRKKLRLAIEEQRRPDLIRYPTIGQLGHTWVASEWLPDIGLPQYAESFLHSLVDARMLDTLSKKELEKYLGVTRKFHQASIVHGIHVLRILKYDRQGLALRRLQSENVDADPIVWTNQRFIRWARSIDLGEYAENLKDSGVHGGLVVLEPSFSGDTMAAALGIPSSKNIIRRHLMTEFEALILPARATLGQGIRNGKSVIPITGPGGLQQHSQNHQQHSIDRRMNFSNTNCSSGSSLRGSLTKAFRFHTSKRNPEKPVGSSTSPTPSYSSSEGGIYSTIGSQLGSFSSQQFQQQFHHQQHHSNQQIPTPPPSHRVSAPPLENNSTLPRYAQHRRVKSISDIVVVANDPV